MAFSFARIGATLGMRVRDYYSQGDHGWFRLHEKGGKLHCVPAHRKAVSYLNAYIAGAGIAEDRKGPLFRTVGRDHRLTGRPMASKATTVLPAPVGSTTTPRPLARSQASTAAR